MTELSVKDRLKLIRDLKEARTAIQKTKNEVLSLLQLTASTIQVNIVQTLDDVIQTIDDLDKKET